MSNIEVRPAVADDVPGLVESSAGLFAEDAGTRDATLSQQWPRVHGPESMRTGIDDPKRLVLVATLDGAVVGHLTGGVGEPSEVRPIRVATLGSMYVFPEHRNSGVGARLFTAFREWATSAGAQRLAVSAYASNEAAIRFYQRNGFAPRTILLEQPVRPTPQG